MLLKGSHAKVPYVASVKLNPNRPLMRDRFPGNLAFTENLHLEFDSLVTFFVGENGSGKSTLLEAMAVSARLPICGGSMNEVGRNHAFEEKSVLAQSLRLAFHRQPRDRAYLAVRGEARKNQRVLRKQWVKPLIDPSDSQLHQMVQPRLTPAHADALKALLD